MADQGTGLMNLSDLGDMLGSLTRGYEESQLAQQRVLDVTAEESRRVADLTAQQTQLTQVAAEKMARVNAHAQREVDLANSGILGAITAHGASLLDPLNYTASGRASQMDVINQTLQIGNLAVGAEVAASEARVNLTRAEAASTEFSATAGMRRLQSQVENLGLVMQGIGASENLRLASLDKLTPNQLDAALSGRGINASGTAKIGEFEYTKTELLERKKALKTRDELALLSPMITDPDYAAKIGIVHRQILSTMSYGDLVELRQNGGKMPDGSMADLATVDQFMVSKKAFDDKRVSDVIDSTMAKNQLPTAMKGAYERINHFEQLAAANPNSPLTSAIATYKSAVLAIDTAGAMNDSSGNAQVVAKAKLDEYNTMLDKAVMEDAKARAGGNQMLATILRDQAYGLPANPVNVYNYVREQFTSGKPLGPMLNQKETAALQASMDTAYKNLRQAAVDSGEKPDDKAIRAEAAKLGYDLFIENQSDNILSNVGVFGLRTRQDNPLKANRISEGEYTQINALATDSGFKQALIDVGLPGDKPEEYKKALLTPGEAGKTARASLNISDATAAALASSWQQAAVMYELDMLESRTPGLGVAYADWLIRNGQDLAASQTMNRQVGNTYELDLFGPAYKESVANKMQENVALYSRAVEGMTGRAQRVMTESMLKAKDPNRMIPIVMTMVGDVTAEDKKRVMDTIIGPALNVSTKRRLSPEETSAFIMEALNRGVEGDKALSVAAKNIARGLPGAFGNYNTVLDALTSVDKAQQLATNGSLDALSAGATGFNVPTRDQADQASMLVTGSPKYGNPYGALGGGGISIGGWTPPDPRNILEVPGGLEAILNEMHKRYAQ